MREICLVRLDKTRPALVLTREAARGAMTKVTVVPILISRGGISRSRILQDLEGLPIRYSGDPVLPHPAIADWISRRVMNKN